MILKILLPLLAIVSAASWWIGVSREPQQAFYTVMWIIITSSVLVVVLGLANLIAITLKAGRGEPYNTKNLWGKVKFYE